MRTLKRTELVVYHVGRVLLLGVQPGFQEWLIENGDTLVVIFSDREGGLGINVNSRGGGLSVCESWVKDYLVHESTKTWVWFQGFVLARYVIALWSSDGILRW